jgi:hypothetical protein
MKIRQSLAALPLTPMVALAPKHGDESPEYQNSKQNVQGAQDFVNILLEGTLTKTRPNGDTLYYDPATNTFASKLKTARQRRCSNRHLKKAIGINNDARERKSLTGPML